MITGSSRFDSLCQPVTESGCWIWTGSVNQKGYGRVLRGGKWKNGGRWAMAHRLVWKFVNGEIPDGKIIMHKCDVPSCINPSHLCLGTHAENAADKVAKMRQTKGEKSPAAKLTEEMVRDIRTDRRSHSAVAAAFGVSKSAIQHVRSGYAWGHVK